MSGPDGADRPPLRDIFDELPPEQLRDVRARREETSADPSPEADDGVTQAQRGDVEPVGDWMDKALEVGADKLEQMQEFAERVGDQASGFATAAAEMVGSAANNAWESATGGSDDGEGDGDDGDDEGGDASGGDTISGGELVQLQSSPDTPIDPGVYVQEHPSGFEPTELDAAAPDLDSTDDGSVDDLLP